MIKYIYIYVYDARDEKPRNPIVVGLLNFNYLIILYYDDATEKR